MKIIVPLVLIVMMSWIVFWIDPSEAAIQISVAATSMLTLIAYRFIVDGLVPRVSYLTRLDWLIVLSTILVFVTLVEALVTSVLHEQGRTEEGRRLDRISRVIFPAVFLALSFVALAL